MSSYETTVWTEASPIVITDIWGKTVEGFWLLISFCGKFGLCCFHAWLNLLQYTTEGGSIHNATEFERLRCVMFGFIMVHCKPQGRFLFHERNLGCQSLEKGIFLCADCIVGEDYSLGTLSYALFKSMRTIWRSLQASIFFY